jgi:hypothetical protein
MPGWRLFLDFYIYHLYPDYLNFYVLLFYRLLLLFY